MRRALILLAAAIVCGCGGGDNPAPVSTDSSGLEREIKDFSLTESREAVPVWELHARTAWRIPNDTRTHLEDVDLLFFDQDGVQDSRLTARKGVVDEKTGQMTATGHVRLISTAGDTLSTEELSYARNKDTVTGPGFVRISKPDRVLTGWDFDAKPDLSTYEIRRNVNITLVERGNPDAP
jgi:LPS export ABC transporter protein LptC